MDVSALREATVLVESLPDDLPSPVFKIDSAGAEVAWRLLGDVARDAEMMRRIMDAAGGAWDKGVGFGGGVFYEQTRARVVLTIATTSAVARALEAADKPALTAEHATRILRNVLEAYGGHLRTEALSPLPTVEGELAVEVYDYNVDPDGVLLGKVTIRVEVTQ